MSEQNEFDVPQDEQRLDEWLSSAPRVATSREFTAQVMSRIEHRQPTWRERVREFLLAPHALRWNMAGAAAVFSLVVAVTLGFQVLPSRDPAPGAELATVSFEIRAPQAEQVALAGNFSDWQPRIPLRKSDNGRWIAEVELPPGSYEYAFVLDGDRWVADPRAASSRDDGFGNRNSVRTVSL